MRPRLSRHLDCPCCSARLEVGEGDAGYVVKCPHCNSRFVVPADFFLAPIAEQRQKLRAAKRVFVERRNALAKLKTREAVRSGWVVTWKTCCILGILALAGFALHLIDSPLPVALAILCAGIVVGPGTFLAKLPWFVLNKKATERALRREEDKQVQMKRKAEESRRRMELEVRKKHETQEAQRMAQTAMLEAQEARQRQLAGGGSSGWWQHLGWWDFEIAVLLALESKGYEARATSPSNDAGLDGILSDGKILYGVQCKHLFKNDRVKVGEIRDFIGALKLEGLNDGFFATTGKYSHACSLAKSKATQQGVRIRFLRIKDLVEMGTGLGLTKESIGQAKRRWNVPEEPPPDMPQGPRRPRDYS